MRLVVRWRFNVLPAIILASLGLLLIRFIFTGRQNFFPVASSFSNARENPLNSLQLLPSKSDQHLFNQVREVQSFVGKSSPLSSSPSSSLSIEAVGSLTGEQGERIEVTGGRERKSERGSKQQATVMTLQQQQLILLQREDMFSSFLSSNSKPSRRQQVRMRMPEQEEQKQKRTQPSGESSNLVKLDRTAKIAIDGRQELAGERQLRAAHLGRRFTRSLDQLNTKLLLSRQQQQFVVASSNPNDSNQQRSSPLLVLGVLGERLTIPCASSPLPSPVPVQVAPGDHQQVPNRRRQQQQQHSQSCPNNQSISLVVWYKDAQLDSPIFSADARQASNLRNSRQQTGSQLLANRAHLDQSTATSPVPVLIIERATTLDSGLYTCTLEFCKAPTQTHQIRLQIIHPPRNMTIRDHNNQLARGTSIGPYEEHSHLTFTCQVHTPGVPPIADIHWWKLKSVSNLPLSSATSSIIFPSEQHNSTDYHLTTLELFSNASQGDSSYSGERNYFVALQPAGQEVNLAKLPFKNGRLKHWIRLSSSKSTSLSTSKSTSSDNKQTNSFESTIQIEDLNRADLGQEFLCLARNNDLSSPLNSSVQINMNLQPTEVKIVNKLNTVFKLNQKTIIECQVLGSKPSAEISWFRGNQVLNLAKLKHKSLPERVVEINDDDSSDASEHHPEHLEYVSEINRDMVKVSYLTFIPQMNDNQQSLTCSALNPAIPNSTPMSDSISMNLLFPAQMKLQLGTGIREESIKIGSDVFMDCNVHSNPPIDEILWLFNDQPVNTTSSGIIMSKQSLVIQHIQIQHRGHYQCMGQNSMGKFFSNKLSLKPQFEPVCDYSRTKTRYEIAVNQAMSVECNVLAEPDDELQFEWKFNQTTGDEYPTFIGHLDDLKQFKTNFTKSTVIFKPTSRYQNGQLLCSASNSKGKQEKPCIIQVIVSELPDPVFSCWFDNHTNTSFSVHCQSSQQSSTSRQTYLLELHTNKSSTLHDEASTSHMDTRATTSGIKSRKESSSSGEAEDAEISSNSGMMLHSGKHAQPIKKLNSDTPTFYVDNLEPGTSYNAVIYVQNSKGLSVPVFYQTSTLPSAEASLRSLTSLVEVDKNEASLSESKRLTDKLITYLKLGNYLKSDYSRPLALALIVLLSSMLIVILAFFTTRLCKPSQLPEAEKGSTSRKRAGRRRGLRSNNSMAGASLEEKSVDGAKKMATYDKTVAQVEKNVHLALATPLRLKGLAGSGSDTSRETNTDSTLISLYRYGATKVVPAQIPTRFNEQLSQQQEYTVDEQSSVFNNNRTTYNNNNNNNNNNESSNRLLQNNQLTNSLPLRHVYPKQNYSVANQASSSPVSILKQQQEEMRQVNSLHSAFNCSQLISNSRGPLPDNELGKQQQQQQQQITPQVSMQSDSECNSTNELQADASDFHDQFLIGYHNNNLSEPIYVIGAGNAMHATNSPHQLCLINPNSLCPLSDPIEYGRDTGSCSGTNPQLGSSMTTSSFDRTLSASNYSNTLNLDNSICPSMLVRNHPTHQPAEMQQIPVGFMANSASIPVSLSECPHSLRVGSQQRRSSHGYLTEDMCLDGTTLNMSYLTLR